jgi:hypothetical protein
MTSANTTLRTLLLYAVVLPLAIYVGYLVAYSAEAGRYIFWWQSAFVIGVICMPLLLKWHHPLLFLCWNMTAVVFFLPGHPQIWMAMAITSLALAMVQRALLRDTRWIHAPSVVLPLLFLAAVIYTTGTIRDGRDFLLKVNVLGAQTVGAKAYYLIYGGMIGLLAMISRPVPLHKAGLYAGMFFLGAIVNTIGSSLAYIPPKLWFIFLVFPSDTGDATLVEEKFNRYYGLSLAAMGCYYYLFARYGVKEILQWKGLVRLLLILAMVVITAESGFRGYFILLALTFLLLFYFEGLVRTKYMAVLATLFAIATLIVVPYATHLPLGIQRSLSFLPIEVNPDAAENARTSSEWRLQMWQEVLPVVPTYFWLGKGIGISGAELQSSDQVWHSGRGMISQYQGALVAGSFHNGPLTTIVFFGIWGVLGLLWFFGASIRAMYLNYLFGDESLKKINALLLSYFIARVIFYLAVFGDFRTDFPIFCGIIGFNLALNGGICKGVRVHKLVQPLTLQRFRPMLKTVPEREAVTPAPSQ